MGKKDWRFYYFATKDPRIPEKWVLLRKIGKDHLSQQAQRKLEWMIFYYTVGQEKAKTTATYFGISRKTLHKWLSRFNETNLKTLEEHSRCPHAKRGWEVTREEEANILHLRRKNMEYGKKKLKVLYKREYGIERVIRKHKLYPDPVRQTKRYERKANSKLKLRLHEVKDIIAPIKEFGLLWHIDAIILWWYGQRRVIFTALEAYQDCICQSL